LTYYSKPENEYFIWIFSKKSQQFLYQKIKTACVYSTALTLPVIISLILFYPGKADVILMFFLVGETFLWTLILAKYSVYPNEMNLPEVILIAVSAYFPPLLIVIIPFFYVKSVKKLNSLLK